MPLPYTQEPLENLIELIKLLDDTYCQLDK